jgi:hypothetical protein
MSIYDSDIDNILEKGEVVYGMSVRKQAMCDICKVHHGIVAPADVDGKTTMGPWANMCREHAICYGIGLGQGRGQVLLPLDDSEPTPMTIGAVLKHKSR